MKYLLIAYLWVLLGDILLGLTRWGRGELEGGERAWWILLWPTKLYWVATGLIEDWRTELYERTKHR